LVLGISRERIRQIEKVCIGILKSPHSKRRMRQYADPKEEE
jgi:DNA-directed RNA polymerase sigma subunit (sigma70/sigma32)